MPPEPVVGWDVGGAHLKAARLGETGAIERVIQLPCPLWQGMERLEAALAEALAALGPAGLHAVTMTGEMVDLFAGRNEGVAAILGAMRKALAGATLRVWAGRAGLVSAEEAHRLTAQVASANWLASATLVAQRLDAAILVDIGSTTTDLVPVAGGAVLARSATDAERLAAGELVYTGVVRTPVMALADRVPFAGDWVPLMAEFFATAADVYRLTGRLPEGVDLHPAADGGPKTVPASARRLARMIGRDVESAPEAAWERLARWLAERQLRRIQDACDRILSREDLPAGAPLVGAGVGRFLAAELAERLRRSYLDFGRLLGGPEAERARGADCAPAVAVAWLAGRGGD
ncbi:MAG TPA: hydantoinase/oxoprolinase family protein [Gemmatimonadales bacterium]|nr:hydantoinase/oxoprolinase family protein [Gemmatimonadales bacterium]